MLSDVRTSSAYSAGETVQAFFVGADPRVRLVSSHLSLFTSSCIFCISYFEDFHCFLRRGFFCSFPPALSFSVLFLPHAVLFRCEVMLTKSAGRVAALMRYRRPVRPCALTHRGASANSPHLYFPYAYVLLSHIQYTPPLLFSLISNLQDLQSSGRFPPFFQSMLGNRQHMTN